MRFFALTEFCPIGSSFCADHACKNCTMRVPLAGCPALTFEFQISGRRIWKASRSSAARRRACRWCSWRSPAAVSRPDSPPRTSAQPAQEAAQDAHRTNPCDA